MPNQVRLLRLHGHLDTGEVSGLAEAIADLQASQERLTELMDTLSTKPSRRRKRANISPELIAHAVEVFGSEATAHIWLSSECGSLNNRTPLQVIQTDGNESEVERVLGCIDYGMIA